MWLAVGVGVRVEVNVRVVVCGVVSCVCDAEGLGVCVGCVAGVGFGGGGERRFVDTDCVPGVCGMCCSCVFVCWGWAAVRRVVDNDIKAEGCKWLSEAVKESRTLTSLDVAGKCVCMLFI